MPNHPPSEINPPPHSDDLPHPPPPSRLSRLGSFLRRRLWPYLGLLAFFTALSLIPPRLHWLLALTGHFKIQYAVFGLFLSGTALAARAWRPLAVALFLLTLNLAAFAPTAWLLSPPAQPTTTTTKTPAPPGDASPTPSRLKLMLLNVHTGNQDHAPTLELIQRADPDLIGLLEINHAWATSLRAGLSGRYPHQVLEPLDHSNFGVALFSKLPLQSAQVIRLAHPEFPAVVATFIWPGHPAGVQTSLLLIHPIPPIGADYTRLRDLQLHTAAARLDAWPGPRILMGDLNITPWAPPFQRLLHEGGLYDTRLGQGLHTSWPAPLPAPLRIPIDHVLVSSHWRTLHRQVGPAVGSDHLPILTELAPQPPPQTP